MWVPKNSKNKLPGYPLHYVSASGVVVNENKELLLVQ
jgi:hypothetical protein